MLQGKRAAAAHLYYLSNSVRFGSFELSVHRDNPDLPLSPIYLHYPKVGEPGSELLPALYELIGQLFFEESQTKQLVWDRIAGVPKGARPLAASLAGRYDVAGSRAVSSDYLLTFGKEEQPGQGTVFTGPEGNFQPNDVLLIVEDHTSGGRNKKLICAAAEAAGLRVDDILTVVDRQQGGVAAMAHEGIRLHALFTLDDLLEFGCQQEYIDEDTVDRVRSYIAANQLWTPPDPEA